MVHLCKSSEWSAHGLVGNPDEPHGNLVPVQCFPALLHQKLVHLKEEEEEEEGEKEEKEEEEGEGRRRGEAR